MLKILFLSSHYPPHTRGGAEISTHYLARGLMRLGHEVTVVTDGEKPGTATIEGVPVRRIPLGLTGKPLFEQRAARQSARRLQHNIDIQAYDIVHSHDFRSALMLAQLPVAIPVITVRDYAPICGTTNNVLRDGTRCTCTVRDLLRTQRIHEASWPRKAFRLWQYRYNIPYRRKVFSRFPHQIFISHAQEAEIRQQLKLPQGRTAVIYNPIAPEFLTDPVRPKSNGDVLYIGRVEDYKGVGLLLRAWRTVSEDFPHAHLHIAGEGAQRDAYERYIRRHGLQYRVTFVGKVPWDRLKQTYDNSSIVVAPHIWTEPFGRTVAEAMARGRVVVSAKAGGPAEMITAGVTGFLFERGNHEALTAVLSQALSLRDIERREIQTAARRWVQEHLAIDTIAEQYTAYYKLIYEAVTVA